jgi:hypothetical protein
LFFLFSPWNVGAQDTFAWLLGRVLRRAPPHPPIRAAPGARATCTAVFFGVLEAYPPLGTTPEGPGRELAAVREIAINPHTRFWKEGGGGGEMNERRGTRRPVSKTAARFLVVAGLGVLQRGAAGGAKTPVLGPSLVGAAPLASFRVGGPATRKEAGSQADLLRQLGRRSLRAA